MLRPIGLFLFHRGLPFHQSCFYLIAPSFILCPQFVRTGGRHDTTIPDIMLYHTTLRYAILYDTFMSYHIEVGLPILQHSGQRILKTISFAKSSDHFLHVTTCKGTPLLSPCITRHYTTLHAATRHYNIRYLISLALTWLRQVSLCVPILFKSEGLPFHQSRFYLIAFYNTLGISATKVLTHFSVWSSGTAE